MKAINLLYFIAVEIDKTAYSVEFILIRFEVHSFSFEMARFRQHDPHVTRMQSVESEFDRHTNN